MRFHISTCIAAAIWLCLTAADFLFAQNYRIERVASGLNQPTFVSQAPGDPANILYYTERTKDANPGFGASNSMGRVWRYDMDTRSSTLVLDLSQYFVTNDTGVQTIAFHPDFNTPASDGYGKLYVSHAEASGSATGSARNRVEEYNLDIAGPSPTYSATLSRLLLQYDNNTQNNHTINWIGFDPTAAGSDRTNLYISTGDGSFGNSYNGGISPTGRPSQNPNDIAGKMLRVDVDGADAYPDDPLKNFAIPASNPIPTYNSVNPGSPIAGLGEVYLTGLRNTYRASFDRQTGDLWMGDVGETTTEEVNILKAGDSDGGPPVDYGWPQREGTGASGISGTTGVAVNPFTGVMAREPVWEFPRASAAAAIGGYLYRGPVQELQGKYFYADFVGTGQAWMLDFDRDTDPATYNGSNGTNTDLRSLWQSLVYDPTDPSYQPDSTTASSAGIDHIVSFGEDNSGNLYIVDFGNGSGFGGQYPGAGLGEIFRIVPNLQITVTVNRTIGEIVFSNQTGTMTDIRGYTISSFAGAINSEALTPITNRLDNGPDGNGQIDPTNSWEVTSAADDLYAFSESSTGSAAILDIDEEFILSPSDGWIQSIYEDMRFSVVLEDGTILPATVEFIGNSNAPFQRSDLNFNGTLDPGDWDIFRASYRADLSDLTLAEAYQLGDLDGDGDNDFYDFRVFQGDYTAMFGAAAFAALLNVPEPTSFAMGATMIGLLAGLRRRRRGVAIRTCSPGRLVLMIAAAWIVVGMTAVDAHAALMRQYTFNEGSAEDSIGTAHGTLFGGATINLGKLVLPGTTGSYVGLPGAEINMTSFTDMSFEAWFTFQGGGVWQRVFDFGRTQVGQGRDYVFYSPNSGGGDNRAAIRNDNDAENVATAGPTVAHNTLHHVVVTIDDDANGGTNRMSLYLNGVPGNDVALSYSLSQLSNTFAYLGRSTWNADPYLNGSIDEFRIYDHALSLTEVQNNFAQGPVKLDLLRLDVNTFTGNVTLVNTRPEALTFDYYSVASLAGALDTAGWNSLDEQNIDAIGGSPGQSWDLLGLGSEHEVSEAFLQGASTLAPGASLDLGKLFDPSVFGKRNDGDLTFEFALQGSDLVTGIVNYVTPPPLLGDYNDDGVVDAADYVVWRDNLGANITLPNEAVTPGVVNQADYDEWKARFGDALGGGSLAAAVAVPEPAATTLMIVACIGVFGWRVRFRTRGNTCRS